MTTYSGNTRADSSKRGAIADSRQGMRYGACRESVDEAGEEEEEKSRKPIPVTIR